MWHVFVEVEGFAFIDVGGSLFHQADLGHVSNR